MDLSPNCLQRATNLLEKESNSTYITLRESWKSDRVLAGHWGLIIACLASSSCMRLAGLYASPSGNVQQSVTVCGHINVNLKLTCWLWNDTAILWPVLVLQQPFCDSCLSKLAQQPWGGGVSPACHLAHRPPLADIVHLSVRIQT